MRSDTGIDNAKVLDQALSSRKGLVQLGVYFASC